MPWKWTPTAWRMILDWQYGRIFSLCYQDVWVGAIIEHYFEKSSKLRGFKNQRPAAAAKACKSTDFLREYLKGLESQLYDLAQGYDYDLIRNNEKEDQAKVLFLCGVANLITIDLGLECTSYSSFCHTGTRFKCCYIFIDRLRQSHNRTNFSLVGGIQEVSRCERNGNTRRPFRRRPESCLDRLRCSPSLFWICGSTFFLCPFSL